MFDERLKLIEGKWRKRVSYSLKGTAMYLLGSMKGLEYGLEWAGPNSTTPRAGRPSRRPSCHSHKSGRRSERIHPEAQGCLDVFSNWRSTHTFPLNTMQMLLRRIAKSVIRPP